MVTNLPIFWLVTEASVVVGQVGQVPYHNLVDICHFCLRFATCPIVVIIKMADFWNPHTHSLALQ